MRVPGSQQEIRRIRRILRLWGKEGYRDFPWREQQEPWHALVAEILLQRTRADNVVPVYQNFVRAFPTVQSLAEATEDEIGSVVFPLGLHWRVAFIKQLAQKLHNIGGVPETYEELIGLPGVGPYIASAWLSFHGDRRGVLIDSNVVRWICRMAGKQCDGETRRKIWLRSLMEELTPSRGFREFNYALLDFTMEICTPGIPHCEICPFVASGLCEFGKRRLEEVVST